MDPLNRDSIPSNHDDLVRGNNDHLHYASDMKECNDVLKAGKFGKKRKMAALFKSESDEKMFNSNKIVHTLSSVVTTIGGVSAGAVLVVTGTVAVAEINSPKFNIDAETNSVVTTRVDYVITGENVDEFAGITYTVDYKKPLEKTYTNIVPKTSINAAILTNNIDMSAYPTGDLYFKIIYSTVEKVETLKEYTYRYVAPKAPAPNPEYDVDITVSGTDLAVILTLTNVTDYSTYTYSVTHTYIDPQDGQEYTVPVISDVPISAPSEAKTMDISNYGDGTFTVTIYNDGNYVYSENYAYTRPITPTYYGSIDVDNGVLKYDFTIENVADLSNYSFDIYMTRPTGGRREILGTTTVTDSHTVGTINVSNYGDGTYHLEVSDGTTLVINESVDYARPTYTGTISITDDTLYWNYSVKNVKDFSGLTYKITYTKPGDTTVEEYHPATDINEGNTEGGGSGDIAGYDAGTFAILIEKDSVLLDYQSVDYSGAPDSTFTGSYIRYSSAAAGLVEYHYEIHDYVTIGVYSYGVKYTVNGGEVQRVVGQTYMTSDTYTGTFNISDVQDSISQYGEGSFVLFIAKNGSEVFTTSLDYECTPSYTAVHGQIDLSGASYLFSGEIEIKNIPDPVFASLKYSYNISFESFDGQGGTNPLINILPDNEYIVTSKTEIENVDVTNYANGNFYIDIYKDGVLDFTSSIIRRTTFSLAFEQTNYQGKCDFYIDATQPRSNYTYDVTYYTANDQTTPIPLTQRKQFLSSHMTEYVDLYSVGHNTIYLNTYKGDTLVDSRSYTSQSINVTPSLSQNGKKLDYTITLTGTDTYIIVPSQFEYRLVKDSTSEVITTGTMNTRSASGSFDMDGLDDGTYNLEVYETVHSTTSFVSFDQIDYAAPTQSSFTVTIKPLAPQVEVLITGTNIDYSSGQYGYKVYFQDVAGGGAQQLNQGITAMNADVDVKFDLSFVQGNGVVYVELYNNGVRINDPDVDAHDYVSDPISLSFQQQGNDLVAHIEIDEDGNCEPYYIYKVEYRVGMVSGWRTFIPANATSNPETIINDFTKDFTIPAADLSDGDYRLAIMTVKEYMGDLVGDTEVDFIEYTYTKQDDSPNADVYAYAVSGGISVTVTLNDEAYANIDDYKLMWQINDPLPTAAYIYMMDLTDQSITYFIDETYLEHGYNYEIFVGNVNDLDYIPGDVYPTMCNGDHLGSCVLLFP